jgi:regulatory protein
LARRALSALELRRRLARHGYGGEEIAAVEARLKALRYLDDLDFARSWARSRSQRRSLGPARLAQELRGKGIAEPDIMLALNELLTERDARAVAEEAAARKLKTLRGLPPEAARRRLAAHLERQGFAMDVILVLCRTHFPSVRESPDEP